MLDLSKLPRRDDPHREESLRLLYPDAMVQAILQPAVHGLLPPHDVRQDRENLTVAHFDENHSITNRNLTHTISVRRALLIGATQSSPRRSLDDPSQYTDCPHRSTPLDDLASILGGNQTLNQSNYDCPPWMISESPQFVSEWTRPVFARRKDFGLEYIVRQIDINQRGAQHEVYSYLDNLRTYAADNDFLLIVIEGQTFENCGWHLGKDCIDSRTRLMSALLQIPGWKFVADFSANATDTLQARVDATENPKSMPDPSPQRRGMQQGGGKNDSEPSGARSNDAPCYQHNDIEKIAVLAACSNERITSEFHTTGVWDYFLHEIIFQHSTAQLDLRRLISENIDTPLIPRLDTWYNVLI